MQIQVIDNIIYWAEIIGTIAFALSGAMVGIEKRFDIFGIIVLAISTAVGGGAIRDVMIGRTPPNMFVQPIYATLAIVSAIVVFILTYNARYFSRYRKIYFFLVEAFDTIGLGVFAITASNLIIELYPGNLLLTCFMAFLTGAGGGILRDMMSGRISVVLRKRIYAVAAIAGSALYYFWYDTHPNKSIIMIICILVVILIRMVAVHYHWNLPKPSEDYFRVMEEEMMAKQHWEQTADPKAVKFIKHSKKRQKTAQNEENNITNQQERLK